MQPFYIEYKGGVRRYHYKSNYYSASQLLNYLMNNEGMSLAEAITFRDTIKNREELCG